MKDLRLLARIVICGALIATWLQPTEPPPLEPDDERPPYVPAVLESAAASPPSPPPEVEHGRCETMLTTKEGAPECIYRPGSELRLWVVHPRVDQVVIEIDGRAVVARSSRQEEEPGLGFDVPLPADSSARALTVRIPDEDPWVLPLRSIDRLGTDEAAARERLREEGQRLEVHAIKGHLDAMPYLYRTVDRAFSRGLLHDPIVEVLVASYHLGGHPGRPDLAVELIDALPELERYPWGRAAASIYRGNALYQQDRLAEAAIAYRVGARYASRMDDLGLKLDSWTMYARVLAELGYFEAAARWSARVGDLVDRHEGIALQVEVLTTMGWTHLRLREAGHPHADPGQLFRAALALAAEHPDEDHGELAGAELGLAKLAQLDGAPARALAHLERLEDYPKTPRELPEVHELRLRSLLAARGPRSAAEIGATLTELEEAARLAVSPTARWRATLARGLVRQWEGDLPGAQAAYEHAEALIDSLLPLAQLGASGSGPWAFRESTDRLITVLLEQDRPDEALCVARQAQARTAALTFSLARMDPRARESLQVEVDSYLRALSRYEGLLRWHAESSAEADERALREAVRQREALDTFATEILSSRAAYRGRPPCEELRARQPGELLLALTPHHDDLLVLVADARGTTWQTLGESAALLENELPPELEAWLLGLLEDRLGEARSVRVLASDRAARLAVHALTWRGEPLAARIPLVYGLDLPPLLREPPSPSGTALVFADPLASGAGSEADFVVDTLRAEGTKVLRGDPMIDSAPELLRWLEGVDLFHYAGHASHPSDLWVSSGAPSTARVLWPPYPGGFATEPTTLSLGESAHLGIQEVLMAPRVPRTVVLMACATGAFDPRSPHGGISLAAAFLGAGAEAVVATTRSVNGGDASLVGTALYAAAPRDADDPGAWLMHGLRWAMQRGLPPEETASYRVLVP